MLNFLILLSLLLISPLSYAGVDMDGTDDFLNCGSKAALDISGQALTISAWIKIEAEDNGDERMVVSKGGANNAYKLRMEEGANSSDGRYHCEIVLDTAGGGVDVATDGTGDTSDDVIVGQWHNVMMIYDAGTMYCYVDGAEAISSTAPSGNIDQDASDDLCIGINSAAGGGCDTDRHMNGIIDEVAIWDAVLDSNEIAQIASAHVRYLPLQIERANLQAYWPMHDITNGSSADGLTFFDHTGNANGCLGNDGATNGTLLGAAGEVLSYP